MIRLEGKQITLSACNSGTSAVISKEGELFMFGKDTAYCDHNTGKNLPHELYDSSFAMMFGFLLLPFATKLRRLYFHRRVSVHRGVPGPGGCLLPGGVCVLPGGVPGPGGVSGPWGVWSQGGGSAPGGLLSQHALRQTHPGRDYYCCGRYASYWNAFLFN